jgi:hypothetical protein
MSTAVGNRPEKIGFKKSIPEKPDNTTKMQLWYESLGDKDPGQLVQMTRRKCPGRYPVLAQNNNTDFQDWVNTLSQRPSRRSI